MRTSPSSFFMTVLILGLAGCAATATRVPETDPPATAQATPAAADSNPAAAAPPATDPTAATFEFFDELRRGQCGKIAQRLDRGASADIKDNWGYPALVQAVAYGFKPCIETLLKHNANVNTIAPGDKTALMTAALGGAQADVIDLLLDRGAPIDARDAQGCTALWFAATSGALPVVDHLIKRGATLPGTQAPCSTPLKAAELNGFVTLAGRLKQAGLKE